MKDHTYRRAALVALALHGFSLPLFAAIQLAPIVSSGLSSPLFVGHAGDGSNRLFIVERAGYHQVLQPGSSTPTLVPRHRRPRSCPAASAACSGSRSTRSTRATGGSSSSTRATRRWPTTATSSISEFGCRPIPTSPSTAETVLLTIEHSAQRQPQRRHDRVRLRRLPAHRRRRRRRRQRPAEQRPEHQHAARQDPAHRRRPSRPARRSIRRRPTTRSSALPGSTRSSRSGGATRGASASIATPASSGWPTSVRARARRSTRRS